MVPVNRHCSDRIVIAGGITAAISQVATETALPGLPFPESFDDSGGHLMVFHSPVGCDQQSFGRLGGESLDVDVGVQPFGKADAEVDIFIRFEKTK